MNILTDSFDSNVYIDGKAYPVRCDFKTVIKIICFFETDEKREKKLAYAFSNFYKVLPDSAQKAESGIESFFEAGKKTGGGKGEKLFSFSRDCEYIYSAFYQIYNIDLAKENFHWYKFCSLFKGICRDTVFSEILKIRSKDLNDIKDPGQRKKMAELKNTFSLDGEMSVEQAFSGLF